MTEAAASVVSTWMGARYTLQNGGSVTTLVLGGGLFQVESLWSSGTYCPQGDVVSYGDDGGCRHERRMPLLSRCQTSRENSCQA
jgi:hypothetical protein